MLPTSYDYVNLILMNVEWELTKQKVKRYRIFLNFNVTYALNVAKKGTVDKITEEEDDKEEGEEKELYHVLIKHHSKR